MTFEEQVRRINQIDQNEKGLLLIKAIEDSFMIEKIVNQILNKPVYKKQSIANKVGQDIIDEFRMQNHYTYFEKELKLLCGFNTDDNLSGDIIFQCFTKDTLDLQKLKDELIELL
jgi:hypothetical protein